MLRTLLYTVILGVVLGTSGIFLAQLLKSKGPGYVLINYNNYSIETSVWVFIGLVLGGLLALFLIIKAISLLIRLIINTGYIAQRMRKRKQQDKNAQGMLAYQSQYWEAASKQLLSSASGNDRPFISYILSAKAFLKLNELDQAQKALKKASECEDIDKISLILIEVDLAFATKDNQHANSLIHEALQLYPKEPRVLLKAFEICQHLHNDELLDQILPQLKKQHLLSDDKLSELSRQHIIAQIASAEKQRDLKRLEKVWKQAKAYHDDPACYLAYFRASEAIGDIPLLMKHCEKQLKKHWNESLVIFYSSISHNKQQQYDFLKGFLNSQGESPILECCLGKIALSLNDKDAAETHLKNSLTMEPSNEVNFLLAKLYAERQQVPESLSYLEHILINNASKR